MTRSYHIGQCRMEHSQHHSKFYQTVLCYTAVSQGGNSAPPLLFARQPTGSLCDPSRVRFVGEVYIPNRVLRNRHTPLQNALQPLHHSGAYWSHPCWFLNLVPALLHPAVSLFSSSISLLLILLSPSSLRHPPPNVSLLQSLVSADIYARRGISLTPNSFSNYFSEQYIFSLRIILPAASKIVIKKKI